MPTFPLSERRAVPEKAEQHMHKFSVNSYEFYLTVRKYGTGEIAELGIGALKGGSTIDGLLNGLSRKTVSLGLQYGIPLENLIQEWKGSRFEPSGFTPNQFIPHAKSLADYVAQYLEHYQAVFPYAKTSNPPTRIAIPPAHAVTHKFSIEGHDCYLTTWFYPRESPKPADIGALKLGFAKEGSPIKGIVDTLCTTASTILQHGVPAKELLKEWKGLSFPPNEWVKDGSGNFSEFSHKSVLDYVASYLLKVLELEK